MLLEVTGDQPALGALQVLAEHLGLGRLDRFGLGHGGGVDMAEQQRDVVRDSLQAIPELDLDGHYGAIRRTRMSAMRAVKVERSFQVPSEPMTVV